MSRSGLDSRSGLLGGNLSLHPNVKVVAIFDEDVTGWKGAHQAFQVREFADQGLGCFAAVNLPPAVIAMSLPASRHAARPLMDQYDHMVVAGLLCEDTTTGRVKTINGHPQAFYQLAEARRGEHPARLVLLVRAVVRRRCEAHAVAVPPGAGARRAPTTRSALLGQADLAEGLGGRRPST